MNNTTGTTRSSQSLRREETNTKLTRLRVWMAENGFQTVILRRTASLAWITAGATTYVNTANGEGPVTAVITADRQYLLTNTIEGPRIVADEGLEALGWEIVTAPWYEGAPSISTVTGIPQGNTTTASDVPFPLGNETAANKGAAISRLRSRLLPVEQERFRQLGAECAEVIQTAAAAVQPGQSEYEIAAHLWASAQPKGIQVIVNLIATDERMYRFRHPLPTAKTLDRHALLVMCGRRDGLVASVSRIVHFGPVPDEIQRVHNAVAHVDAAAITASRPGRTLGDVFSDIQHAYTEVGFPDGWQGHHQGGVAAYEPREYLALPGSEDILEEGMVCAWNPSLPGAKSEDSVIVGVATVRARSTSGTNSTSSTTGTDHPTARPEVVTTTPGWPMIQTDTIPRPGILVR